ncbi:hypothetical protein C8J57DRAFT_1358530, partial [Mycena rebaudengoi]
ACSLRLSLLLLFYLRPFALVSRSAVLITSLSLSTAVCMDLSPPCYRALFPPIWLWISALDWTGTASIQEWLIGLGQRLTDPLSHLHAVEGSMCPTPMMVQAATSPTAAVSLGGSAYSLCHALGPAPYPTM